MKICDAGGITPDVMNASSGDKRKADEESLDVLSKISKLDLDDGAAAAPALPKAVPIPSFPGTKPLFAKIAEAYKAVSIEDDMLTPPLKLRLQLYLNRLAEAGNILLRLLEQKNGALYILARLIYMLHVIADDKKIAIVAPMDASAEKLQAWLNKFNKCFVLDFGHVGLCTMKKYVPSNIMVLPYIVYMNAVANKMYPPALKASFDSIAGYFSDTFPVIFYGSEYMNGLLFKDDVTALYQDRVVLGLSQKKTEASLILPKFTLIISPPEVMKKSLEKVDKKDEKRLMPSAKHEEYENAVLGLGEE